jgi:hypothetical protein
MEILIILIVILVVFYFCYLNSKNNKLTKTEAFNSPDYITVYEHNMYYGKNAYCPIGHTSFEQLKNMGFNDRISSIIIPQGLRAVFYQRDGRPPLSLGAGNYPSLGDGWNGWNDLISSVDVFRV